MIRNEEQYRVTQGKEKQFARLVERMESGTAQSIADEDSIIRQAKLDAARSILQELREELKEWESGQRPDTTDSRQTA